MRRLSRLPRDGWLAALLLVALVVTGCGRGPQPIAFNADTCDYCRMQISDPRFGGEIVTRKGKVLKFDSIECLVDYARQPAAAAAVGTMWVIDYAHPGTLIPAKTARYLQLRPGMSPMGRGLASVAPNADVSELRAAGATERAWSDVQ